MGRMERPAVPASEAFAFVARLSTRWSDEDNQAVLNNAVYLTLLEEARHRYFGGLGLLPENRFPFVLGQCNLRFLKPGVGGVEVLVWVKTERMGTSSIQQSYRIAPASAPDEPWGEAEALLVVVDEAGASAPISPAFRAAVEGLESASGGSEGETS